jgi:hypothetical protein
MRPATELLSASNAAGFKSELPACRQQGSPKSRLPYDAACQSFAGVACGLSTVVIRVLMDYYGLADYIAHLKPVGEETHPRPAIIGKEYGEITGMVAVGLVGWIPVFTGGRKGRLRVAHSAGPVFMNMKAVGTDGAAPIGGAIRGKSGNINGYPYTAGHIPKNDQPPYSGSERSAANFGHRHS